MHCLGSHKFALLLLLYFLYGENHKLSFGPLNFFKSVGLRRKRGKRKERIEGLKIHFQLIFRSGGEVIKYLSGELRMLQGVHYGK